MSKKCSYYEERLIEKNLSDYERGFMDGINMVFHKRNIPKTPKTRTIKEGHCTGQKNCPSCSCFGDKSKCELITKIIVDEVPNVHV